MVQILNKVIRINMADLSIKEEVLSNEYSYLGGRALTSRIIAQEVEATCHPLGVKNKLVFAIGILAGTPVSSANRISIGGKSPLTGGIKESNGGGVTALKMARLGIRMLIIEGKPSPLGSKPDDLPLYTVVIKKDGVQIVEANILRGMGNFQLIENLKQTYGENIAVSSIGPIGERCQSSAGIANTDREGRPSRYCGRGGLGAVMGSKGLKAIIFDDVGCSATVSHNREKFQQLYKEGNQLLLNNEIVAGYAKYGTAGMLENTNAMGILPTRNFSTGFFNEGEKICGEALYQMIKERGGVGDTTHACMPGCVIRCSNVFPDKQGNELVAPLEYETIGLMGSNCEIADFDVIAELNYHCNDYGIDTIEVGAALGVAMEAGLIPFGDKDGAVRLIKEIGEGTVLGRVLGEGAAVTGRVLGVARVPVVKGQAMPAYEPRGIKGLGITYATSPMGADHTAGNTIRQKIDHRNPEGQEAISRRAQFMAALFDSLGLCVFVGVVFGARLDLLASLIEAHSGIKVSEEELLNLGKETVAIERKFNNNAGFTKSHDRLPDFFVAEICPSSQNSFDVSEKQLDSVHQDD
ncbi:MAG: aldehyde ferredoxin oxidoreductase [Clostridia bacterium]|nr:aldehyde ferredoxin oxidoreductase [Clostridia bacterium]